MLKYSNPFSAPYDPIHHNYPYMQNRRLSVLLNRYRWRAQSPFYRPRIIIAGIWIAIIIATVLYVA
jgi:hypothetical protein